MKKTIWIRAIRKDGFKVEGNFKKVSIERFADNSFWVSTDGDEFICDEIVVKRKRSDNAKK
jgi:hypothetical protein